MGACEMCGARCSRPEYTRCVEHKRSARAAREWPPPKPGCLEWPGGRVNGYGVIYVAGKSRRITRWVWVQLHGPIPAGMEVCHTCDNPPCFLPDHLFLGTSQDNNDDMRAKGRGRYPGPSDRGASRVRDSQGRWAPWP